MSTLKSILFFLSCLKLALGSPICDAENGPEPTRIQIQKTLTQDIASSAGEYCSIIAYHIVRTTGYSITTQQIIDWNGLDKECTNLRLYYYACVGVSARSPANVDGSIESPSAAESRSDRRRLGGECIEWAFTKYGHSTCERIAIDFDISVAQLQEWNPETNCNSPLYDGWVCTRK
ncbi:LysM domain-containing protein [Metarhizium anisopliae]|nr:LysM domain-containing protein [Metarhizium anisopliae]